MEITTVGLDLAKNVFQVHAISSTGEVVVRRALRRAQMTPFFSKLTPCLIGIEACGTSHHWARELVALGHEVRLMPPAYVKCCRGLDPAERLAGRAPVVRLRRSGLHGRAPSRKEGRPRLHRVRPDGADRRGLAGMARRRDRKGPRASNERSIGPWNCPFRQGASRPPSTCAARPMTRGASDGLPPALARWCNACPMHPVSGRPRGCSRGPCRGAPGAWPSPPRGFQRDALRRFLPVRR